eukprot:340085-Amphidinium_carterae.1
MQARDKKNSKLDPPRTATSIRQSCQRPSSEGTGKEFLTSRCVVQISNGRLHGDCRLPSTSGKKSVAIPPNTLENYN